MGKTNDNDVVGNNGIFMTLYNQLHVINFKVSSVCLKVRDEPPNGLVSREKNMLTTGFLGSLFSDKPAETKCGMPKKITCRNGSSHPTSTDQS